MQFAKLLEINRVQSTTGPDIDKSFGDYSKAINAARASMLKETTPVYDQENTPKETQQVTSRSATKSEIVQKLEQIHAHLAPELQKQPFGSVLLKGLNKDFQELTGKVDVEPANLSKLLEALSKRADSIKAYLLAKGVSIDETKKCIELWYQHDPLAKTSEFRKNTWPTEVSLSNIPIDDRANAIIACYYHKLAEALAPSGSNEKDLHKLELLLARNSGKEIMEWQKFVANASLAKQGLKKKENVARPAFITPDAFIKITEVNKKSP